jgi:hypothetical protein
LPHDPVSSTDAVASDLSTANGLMALLGTYWRIFYTQPEGIRGIVAGRAQTELLTRQLARETSALIGRSTFPRLARTPWLALDLLASQKTGVASYPAPTGLVGAAAIVNTITNTTKFFVSNIDFIVEDGRVNFAIDPLTDPDVATEPVYDAAGNRSDTKSTLWILAADIDASYVYKSFGYPLSIFNESTSTYADLVDHLTDDVNNGDTKANLIRVLAALTDSKLALVTGEIVQRIYDETSRRLIITDKSVYTVPLGAGLLVGVGDVLVSDQQLTDAFKFVELGQTPPPVNELPGLTLSPELLPGSGVVGALSFANADTPVVVTTSLGRTKVSWSLGGNPTDVMSYWNATHTRGIAGGKTLAQCMDLRPPNLQVGDPTAANLPTSVNPLGFLIANLLRYHTIVVLFEPSSFGPNATWNLTGASLRLAIPPQDTLLGLILLPALTDIIEMGGPGTSVSTGTLESLGLFDGVEPLSELNLTSLVGADTLGAYYV